MEYLNISALVGKTLTGIERRGDDELIFTTSEGERFSMQHLQGCCECVTIEDINGDLDDLIGSPIVTAEESTNSESDPDGYTGGRHAADSFTWTFYRIATAKGWVIIRWLGESNGYYGEEVDFLRLPN